MMWYEWKKIFERRLNLAAMAAGYLLIGICVCCYISQISYYDEKTEQYIEGPKAARLNTERAEKQTQVISEEYITAMIRDMQSKGMDFESDDAYIEIVRPMGDIYYFVVKNYTDMQKNILDEKALNTLNVTEGAHFYEQRMKKITDYLNLDFSYGNYKELEKDYWVQKAKDTVIPFRWGGTDAIDTVWAIVLVGFYLIFVAAICVSPVFASEHETGAVSLLLTTKYGKDRMIWAKIAVSMLFCIVYLSVGNLLAVCAVGLVLGFEGADLPVQLWNSVIPYNMTAGWACVWSFAVILLISLAVVLFMLLCSARLHSSIATLVIGIVVLAAPALFPMSKTSGLWNHINYLFPVRAANLKEVMGLYVSYPFGGHVISYIGMVVIVYTAVGLLSCLLIRKGFIKMR